METAAAVIEIAAESYGHFIRFGLNDLRIIIVAITFSVCAMIDAVEYLDIVVYTPYMLLEIKIHYYDLD